jgi:hypothetical protein
LLARQVMARTSWTVFEARSALDFLFAGAVRRLGGLGGCHLPPTDTEPTGFQQKMSKPEMVKPHCLRHSNGQVSQAAAYARRVLKDM